MSTSRQRFNSIALAAVVVFGLLFAAYADYDRRNALARGDRTAEQLAEMTALAAEGTLESTRQLLHAMAILVRPPTPDTPADPAAIRSNLLWLKANNPAVMDLLIVAGDGRIRHWTGSGTPPDIRDRAYFTDHAGSASSGLHVGAPLLSKVHAGKWFFALSEALRDDQGRLAQVLVVIVDVALLHRRLGTGTGLPGTSQSLLANDGTVYTRTPDHALHVGRKVARPNELASLSAAHPMTTMASISQLDQQERIISFRRVGDYPMTAVGTVAVDEILLPTRQRLTLVSGIWLLLTAAIVWITRRANAISRRQDELANIDGLTGVHNRRSILTQASRLERSARHAGKLSMLMIDIDHFKAINDRFGHLVGDEVLRQVAAVLRAQIRSTDIVGRYGGEEFLVLMPDTGDEGALLVAEKLCSAVASRVTQPVQVTVSIGVATSSERDAALDRTLSRADAALYQAKNAGRNCVRPAGDTPGRPEQPA